MLSGADTVLEVDNVSKLYSRSAMESQQRLGQVIRAACFGRDFTVTSLRQKEFWALEDVSFLLNRGDAMGVIGLNGAGKTTLLRLLTGQFPPDRGEIRVAGRAGSMIDLTVGLNDRMSGRENIYLRSASLGRRREEVDETLEEMIDFMELGDALEAPISTYSAGMRMRLAFATTVFINPDLLIIDEVLSVGDFRFRQKCLEHIRHLRSRCAFVLASHSMRDISQFCTEAIVLEKGRIAFKGAPDEAVNFFQKNQTITQSVPAREVDPTGEMFANDRALSNVAVDFVNANGEEISVSAGEPLTLTISITAHADLEDLKIGLPVWNDKNILVTACSSQHALRQIRVKKGEVRRFELTLDTSCLNPGVYQPVVIVKSGVEYLYRQKAPPFTISGGDDRTFFWGIVTLPAQWRVD